MAGGIVSVQYSASAFPVTLGLGGTVESGGLSNALVGQRIGASLTCSTAKLTNYQWTIPGETFKSFTISGNQNQGFVENLQGPDYAQSNPYWSWKKDGGSYTVSCTAQASVSGHNIGSVTAEKKVLVWTPYYNFRSKSGPVSLNDGYVRAGSADKLTPGMEVRSRVGTPALFSHLGFGECAFLQLCRLNRQQVMPYIELVTGTVLDNGFPYSEIWDADSMEGTHTGGRGLFEDIPEWELKSTATAFNITDSFALYLMYRPAGEGSQWVPLHLQIWGWNASGSRSNLWSPFTFSPAPSVSIYFTSAWWTHPEWSDKYVNGQ